MKERWIRKSPTDWPVPPNLGDYDAARTAFSWAAAKAELTGLPGGRGLNMAHEAVDCHAQGPLRGQTAVRWLGPTGAVEAYSYADLARLSNRFANVLGSLGLGQGDRVFSLLGRSPENLVAAFGALKNRCVFCPLYAAFGPEPVATRLRLGEARALVTTETLFRRKLQGVAQQIPGLRDIIVLRDMPSGRLPAALHDYRQLMEEAGENFQIPPTDAEDPALLHFTSGTTGPPKGALHAHAAVVTQHATARLALDLRPQDIYWCTADPGWVTGTVYGMIAPLTVGATLILDPRPFDARQWYQVLRDERVSVWYTAPTALRLLMKNGLDLPRRYDLSSLRLVASVGEPLSPAAVTWGREALGRPIHDTWWQTETGAIMIANYPASDIKPGSMGRPFPGIEAATVRRLDRGRVQPLEGPGAVGELALRADWPSMFRTYVGDEERYRHCFADGWYLTGDLVRRDADGYFWFVGRHDDAIKSSGHLIGPFEVESILMDHPAVAEAGVIGKPDPVAYEVVKAFVVLKPGHTADETLRRSLLAHARTRLGAVVAPKEIAFCDNLPRTPSGKIMRRLLKARDLGLSEADPSALDPGSKA